MNGKLLKEKRISLGKTLEQLADEIGCSVRTLQRYENESINDDDKYYILIRLCKALDLSVQGVLCIERDDYSNTRRTKEKTIEEICQVLDAHNFTEWQYYYNLARENCITDDEYYFIFDVAKRRDAFTEWVGYDKNGNEIRKPRVVKPEEMINLCYKLYGTPIIINDESDVFLFNIFGGYALIKEELYLKYFQDFLI